MTARAAAGREARRDGFPIGWDNRSDSVAKGATQDGALDPLQPTTARLASPEGSP